jgi:hypothetical protein
MGRTRQCPVLVITSASQSEMSALPRKRTSYRRTSPLNANLGHQSLLLQRTVRPENLDIKRALRTSPPQ